MRVRRVNRAVRRDGHVIQHVGQRDGKASESVDGRSPRRDFGREKLDPAADLRGRRLRIRTIGHYQADLRADPLDVVGTEVEVARRPRTVGRAQTFVWSMNVEKG